MHDALPEYLPARMLNEFVYCPRLFFYEWVEGVFRESKDTVEGKIQHARVDEKETPLPVPGQLEEERLESRSVTLSSDRYGVIAKMDLVEVEGDEVTPVDYKHGRPRETPEGIEPWPSDRVQLAVQGLILQENGYRCLEGLVYYLSTKQRVRVAFSQGLLEETVGLIAEAKALAAGGRIPPPLVDSPKCPRCSLVGICLPDETMELATKPVTEQAVQLSLFEREAGKRSQKEGAGAPRRLIAARDELRPVYLQTQGLRVGKTGAVLQVKEKDSLLQELRIGEISQLNLMGNIQLSSQAIQALCQADVPVCYYSSGGWFYGLTTGMNLKNVFLRKAQYRLSEDKWFAVLLARSLVSGKIRNQRTLLKRNHVEPPTLTLRQMKSMAERAERAKSLEELLGIEGHAASLYFGEFAGMIKTEAAGRSEADFRFNFSQRNRRPPRDAVNALLSFAYSLVAKDSTIACYAVGFDPMVGFFHQPRFGRPALALDLMEPFRPLIADSVVLTAINNGMIKPRDFVRAGPATALTDTGRKAFLNAYELRMDTLVTHPMFDYRVSYRRLLEIQTRLLGRFIDGEIPSYPVFVTR